MSQLVVKFGGTTFDNTVDYDTYKIFTDLFLPGEKRDNAAEPEQILHKSSLRLGRQKNQRS